MYAFYISINSEVDIGQIEGACVMGLRNYLMIVIANTYVIVWYIVIVIFVCILVISNNIKAPQ